MTKPINYRVYFALEKRLRDMGNNIERKELIEDFTEGKKSSLKELSAQQYRELCNWITQTFKLNETQAKSDWQNSPENQMRRKIITLFIKMGYTTASGKIDLEKLDKWAEQYGHLKKPLNKYNRLELPKLVSQAEAVYYSFIKSV